jgi:2-dehydropantoate 2-reductase
MGEMRILVVGAGAVGGYFGGRLLEAGRNVTFLVRPRRAALLAKNGLTIRSAFGDYHRDSPPIVTADRLTAPFDLVLLSCKAYDLEDAIKSFAPAVGANTAILPLLNGMRHLDALAGRFGAGPILGGQCAISATLGPDGAVVHHNEMQTLGFGELDGSRSPRIEAIASQLVGVSGFEAHLSDEIRQEMWEKWVFIAAAAGITCLMRSAVGDYVAAGASDLAASLLKECAAIAAGRDFPPRPAMLERARSILTAAGSPLKASMLRDIEGGMPVEGDQILGDLLRRAAKPDESPLLRIATLHVKAYEAGRTRAGTAAKG